MEGEKLLQCILHGDPPGLDNLQDYISPLQKLLESDAVKSDAIVSKYGMFCMKLLRCCIEAVQKKQGIKHEEFFNYAKLGADMLSRLITSDIYLPSNITVICFAKLLFHLIMSALKQYNYEYLVHFSDCLLRVTDGASKLEEANIPEDLTTRTKPISCNSSNDVTSICKKASVPLWNAAVKLEQSKSVGKHQGAVLVFSIRRNSLFLLIVAKPDLGVIVGRGLMTARQLQLRCTEASIGEQLATFLFSLLVKSVQMIDLALKNNTMEEGSYNYLEDLCINCFKYALSMETVEKLQEILSHFIKDSKNAYACQGPSSIFHIILRMHHCSLGLRARLIRLENQKPRHASNWSTTKKELANITDSIKKLDSNLCASSQIIQSMSCLRLCCVQLLNKMKDGQSSHEKIPNEILSSMLNLSLVCFEKSSHSTSQQACASSWEQSVLPRFTLLYFISSLILEGSKNGLEKFLQNGRKISFKSDYVAAMLTGKKTLDELVDVPAATEHYRHLATDAYNVGLVFFNNNYVSDATSLARLSCDAASSWYERGTGSSNILEVLLFKKYELLSDCLEKQGKWEESLRSMTQCCQMYALSMLDFCEKGMSDNKALEHVEKWSNRKHHVAKMFSKEKDVLQIRRSTLYDGWEELEHTGQSHERDVCTLLKMELESYRKKRYCTDDEEMTVIEILLDIFNKHEDNLNVCSMKLEKVKVMHQMQGCVDTSASLTTCKETIEDMNELLDQDSVFVQDIMASSYFWCFILQYSIMANQSHKNGSSKKEVDAVDDQHGEYEEADRVDKVANLNLVPDFLVSLQRALNIWSRMAENAQDLNIVSRNKMCWNLQIASSVYGFLNMPLTRVHTLNVLSAVAQTCGTCEDLQTVLVARSTVIYIFCEEGNNQFAEVLLTQCEELFKELGNLCCLPNKCMFFLAKSYLLLCKGLYDEGWQLLNEILNEVKTSQRPISRLVTLKAKLLGWKYLSLPPSTWKAPINDLGCIYVEYLLDALKYAEALVEYFANGDIDVVPHNCHEQQQYGILLSHWSVLNELMRCLMEIGNVLRLQGSVREASSYLKYGRKVAANFLSPIRFSQFSLHLAELNIFKSELENGEQYMTQVLGILKPGTSLQDILNTSESFDLSSDSSSMYELDSGSLDKVQLQFLLCFCEYLRRDGRSVDVKTAISLLRKLCKESVGRYEVCMKSLECVCERRVGTSDETVRDVQDTSKKNTKAKRSKKVSSIKDTKLKRGNVESATSIAFFGSSLRLAAMECDLALCNGDYTTLLYKFQEGFELMQTAQRITQAPIFLDVTTVSLLYYIRGVAHVLSSRTGFNGWRVAGRPWVTSDDHNDAISCSEDVSDALSRLDISSVDLDEDESVESLTEKLRQESWEKVENGLYAEDVIEREPSRRSRRCRNQPSTDTKSEKPKTKTVKTTRSAQSCKTTRKKASKKTSNIIEAVVRDGEDDEDSIGITEDIQHELGDDKKSRYSRKSVRSTKKNRTTVENSVVKSSTRTRGNTSRSNAASSNCDILAVTEVNADQTILPENGRSGRKNGKKASKKSEATSTRVYQQNNEKLLGSIFEKDEDVSQALNCLQLALEYLHPSYNPVLFSRICHALVVCHGLQSPRDAAIYHNLPFATTLRHQALISSAKKIRKIEEEVNVDGTQSAGLIDCMDSSMAHDVCGKTQADKFTHLKTVQSTISFKTSVEDLRGHFEHFMQLLPDYLTVCTLSLLYSPENKHSKQLVVTRLRKEEKPLILKLKLPGEDDDNTEDDFQVGGSIVRDLFAASQRNIVSDFASVMEENLKSMRLQSTHDWWNKRNEIDEQLQRVLQRLEDSWFGNWRGILSGHLTQEEDIQALKSNLEDIQRMALEILGAPVENQQLLEVFVEWYDLLKPCEIAEGVAEMTGMKKTSYKVIKFCEALRKFITSIRDRQGAASAPRGPVVLILDKAIQHLPFESMPVLRHQEVCRMQSLDFVMSHLSLQTAPVDILTSGVDTQKTFYVLNPRKDLKKTEKIFEEWFTTEEGWTGVVGRPPTGQEVIEALSTSHLYLYLGHGTGREFFRGDEVQRLFCQAVTILMGCSSGKLILQGDCDARGMVLNYLLSGCPAVVANLWDVTDRDIDRFSSALLKTWLKKKNNLSLSRSVTESRKACVLKYLIGSAPVIYGMPVYTKR